MLHIGQSHMFRRKYIKILYVIAKLHLFEFTFALSFRSAMTVKTAENKLFSIKTFMLKTIFEAHCICTTQIRSLSLCVTSEIRES